MSDHSGCPANLAAPPSSRSPVPGSPVWIGLDLGGTTIQSGLVDNHGSVVLQRIIPTPVPGGVGAVLGSLQDLARALRSEAEARGLVPVGLGLGTPGAVDPQTGRILGAAPNLPDWVGTEVRQPLEMVAELPVIVDNDANMAALGEGAFGAGAGCRHFVCLTLGTGIGAGVVVDGRLVRGAGFAAGEAGHMIVHEGGDRCECGSQGCLEAHASAGALIRKAESSINRFAQGPLGNLLIRGSLGAKEIFEVAQQGDPLASELVQEVTVHAGIASIVSLLDPERVILAGGMAGAGQQFIQTVAAAAARRLMPVFARRLTVVGGQLGRWAGVAGAVAALPLDRFRGQE
jgi:glucokinase